MIRLIASSPHLYKCWSGKEVSVARRRTPE
jgi:hypothetical protein